MIHELRRLCGRVKVGVDKLSEIMDTLPEERGMQTRLPFPLEHIPSKMAVFSREPLVDIEETMLMIASHLEISQHMSQLNLDEYSDFADLLAGTLTEVIKAWAGMLLLESIPYGRQVELLLGTELTRDGEHNMSYAVQIVQFAVDRIGAPLLR